MEYKIKTPNIQHGRRNIAMAEVTDPAGEINLARLAQQQTDVEKLIQSYQHWYNWADENEWVAGDAMLKRVGECGRGNAKAVEFLVGEITHYSRSRSKSAYYLLNAAKNALGQLVEQQDPLAIEAYEKLKRR